MPDNPPTASPNKPSATVPTGGPVPTGAGAAVDPACVTPDQAARLRAEQVARQAPCVTPEEAARIRAANPGEPLWVTPDEAARIRAEQERAARSAKAAEQPNPAVEAVHRIGADLNELKDYATFYLTTKVDGIKRTIRNIGLYAALGVVGAIVGGAMLATAAGMIVVAIGQALGLLFGGRIWLGYLVTGILILGAVAGAAWFFMNKLTNSWRSQTIAKYEQLKKSQRERLGHDVSERARRAAQAAGAKQRSAQ
jgi:hypothetical protein